MQLAFSEFWRDFPGLEEVMGNTLTDMGFDEPYYNWFTNTQGHYSIHQWEHSGEELHDDRVFFTLFLYTPLDKSPAKMHIECRQEYFSKNIEVRCRQDLDKLPARWLPLQNLLVRLVDFLDVASEDLFIEEEGTPVLGFSPIYDQDKTRYLAEVLGGEFMPYDADTFHIDFKEFKFEFCGQSPKVIGLQQPVYASDYQSYVSKVRRINELVELYERLQIQFYEAEYGG